MKLAIDIIPDDEITPYLSRLKDKLHGDAGPEGLPAYVGQSVTDVIRGHLITEAAKRHKTAKSLGATPTGHLERGAESVSFTTTTGEAVIKLPILGISRAFFDLTITPLTGKYLTLPARAESYGARARSFTDLKFIPLKKGTVPVLGKIAQGEETTTDGKTRKTRKVEVYYWLKESVTQKQDRTLLPSDKELLGACEEGARDFVQSQMAKRDARRAATTTARPS